MQSLGVNGAGYDVLIAESSDWLTDLGAIRKFGPVTTFESHDYGSGIFGDGHRRLYSANTADGARVKLGIYPYADIFTADGAISAEVVEVQDCTKAWPDPEDPRRRCAMLIKFEPPYDLTIDEVAFIGGYKYLNYVNVITENFLLIEPASVSDDIDVPDGFPSPYVIEFDAGDGRGVSEWAVIPHTAYNCIMYGITNLVGVELAETCTEFQNKDNIDPVPPHPDPPEGSYQYLLRKGHVLDDRPGYYNEPFSTDSKFWRDGELVTVDHLLLPRKGYWFSFLDAPNKSVFGGYNFLTVLTGITEDGNYQVIEAAGFHRWHYRSKFNGLEIGLNTTTGYGATSDGLGEVTYEGRLSFEELPLDLRAMLFGPPDENDDGDADGIHNDNDRCPMTELPEAVPTSGRLLPNHFAITGPGPDFSTPERPGRPAEKFTLLDTAGCSCDQIIDYLQLPDAHRRAGCTIGTLRTFISDVVGPALQ